MEHFLRLPPYFHLWHLPLVFLAGLIGESYGVVVGSGSIVIQFVLISLGMPLPAVIATDIAGAIGTDVGIIAASRGRIWNNRKLIIALAVPLLIGGMIGTLFLVHIPTDWLRYIIIIALVILLAYTLLGPKRPIQALDKLQISKQQYLALFVVMVVLGIYSNTISVGEGTFGKLAIIGILGISFADSLGVRGVAILPARIFSLVLTFLSGLIAWPYLLSLWVGSFLAGKYVTTSVRKIPDRYLRLVLISVTLIYLVYLLKSAL